MKAEQFGSAGSEHGQMMKRRLREGAEFMQFLSRRRQSANA